MVITYETNLRQGGARNVGLSYARGEFIGFVDSDDWVEPQMYEFLLKGIEESGCDISRCKYIRDPGKEGSGYKLKKGSFKNDTVDFEIIKCFENSGFYYMPPLQTSEDNEEYGGIPTMMFRRDLIFDHDIGFPEKISYEDNYWLGLIQLYVSSMCVVDEVLYHYYVNEESTTMKKNDMRQLERLDIEVALLEEYKKRGAFEAFYFRIMADFIQRYYLNTYHILFTRFTDIPDIYGELRETILRYFPDWKAQFDSVNINIVRHSKMLQLLDNNNCTVKDVLSAYMEDHGYRD
jgi:glycosyltransferase involved in cell wall biosynthesis